MGFRAAQLEWTPGDLTLEPSADSAVRSSQNDLVIAGPGAGKTELLAQRACYLLETSTCLPPHRILAISFKRDAARNLRDRVRHRCGNDLVSRFDSYTFDSFCKGLVDRFRLGIPAAFRPSENYRVLDGKAFNERTIVQFVREVPGKVSGLSEDSTNSLSLGKLYRQSFLHRLPIESWGAAKCDEEKMARALWQHLLLGSRESAISFPMIALLSDLLIRTNPYVRRSLRSCYRYVFLDEFQDTSKVHYTVVHGAFCRTSTVVTAVGDNKQRIMVWAGALKNVFDFYKEHFSARTLRLENNHRSGRKLVKVQSVLANDLDDSSVEAISVSLGPGEGECRALEFEDEESEAVYLADLISNWIVKDGLHPRHICILTRMKPKEYTDRLRQALDENGVRSRIETEMQDLLAEPVTDALLDSLKLACCESAPVSWQRTTELLHEIAGTYGEGESRRLVNRLLMFIRSLRSRLVKCPNTVTDIRSVLGEILQFIGEAEFRALHPQYLQDTWYDAQLSELCTALQRARENRSWTEAIAELEGIESVPIMTTHKSKGLEYHTILFVGLEDGALFNFVNNSEEEKCGFFVALSRAKQRAIFTFSNERQVGRYSAQSKTQISSLYELLEKAGVVVEQVLV